MSSLCKFRGIQFPCPCGPLTSPLHEGFLKADVVIFQGQDHLTFESDQAAESSINGGS